MTKLVTKEQFLQMIEEGADLIVPPANGEPRQLLDWLEEGADGLVDVDVHQFYLCDAVRTCMVRTKGSCPTFLIF